MSHSFNKIWIHAIWSTKNRMPLITTELEKDLYKIIEKQFTESGCSLSIINGISDHIHCLFLLNPKSSLADIIKQVKGSSSHLINQLNLTTNKFAWQTGYAAFSISESTFQKVYQYIKNQKQHHKAQTFDEEYDEYLRLYNFKN